MPEALGNKEVFSGVPHCHQCGSKMTSIISQYIPGEDSRYSCSLQSYVCSNCHSGVSLVGYADLSAHFTRDADGTHDKLQSTRFLTFFARCSDTREKVEA